MAKKSFMYLMLGVILTGIFSLSVTAQVTTSEMVGRVTDAQEKPLPGVTVEAVHVPSGTTYTAVTNDAGRFTIPGMRVGGPYTIKAIQAGFNERVVNDVQLSLGTAATINFTLSSAITETVNVEIGETGIFSESRTGAATAISTQQIEALPTISRRISDFTRLSPHAGGGGTFVLESSITKTGAFVSADHCRSLILAKADHCLHPVKTSFSSLRAMSRKI
jgi:hypothetical protein